MRFVLQNGNTIDICKSLINKRQKSYDIYVCKKNNNNYIKVGLITDIKTLEEYIK